MSDLTVLLGLPSTLWLMKLTSLFPSFTQTSPLFSFHYHHHSLTPTSEFCDEIEHTYMLDVSSARVISRKFQCQCSGCTLFMSRLK